MLDIVLAEGWWRKENNKERKVENNGEMVQEGAREWLLDGKNETENETNPECKHWLAGISPENKGEWKQ